MGTAGCPNCGHRLVMLREEQQEAGTRHIWLRWLICSRCRHVALENWSFIDPPRSDTSSEKETSATARRPISKKR